MKIIKLVLISFFIVIFFLLDFYSYSVFENASSLKKYFLVQKNKTEKELVNNYICKIHDIRYKQKFPSLYDGVKNNPILLFGDSWIYRITLNKNENLASQIHLKTKRDVYDQSTPYVKPQHIFFQLGRDEFYKLIKKPDYIFYFYIPFHVMETYTKNARSTHDLFYKLQNKKLVKYKFIPFYKKSFLISHINAKLSGKFAVIEKFFFNKGKEIFSAIMIESLDKVRKYWGDDVKFVIVRFCENKRINENELFDKLQKQGFIIFNLYDYVDVSLKTNYISKTKRRPNKAFFEKIADILIKEFNLNQGS